MRSVHHSDRRSASPVQTAAAVVSLAFLLVGVLGFIPGVTTDYGDLELAGHDSGAQLLGVFQVSALHNVVHLLFGALGLAMSRTPTGARNFLVGGGVVYFLVFVYGLLVGEHSQANFLPLDDADDVLHLVLSVGMVALGLALGTARTRRVSRSASSSTKI